MDEQQEHVEKAEVLDGDRWCTPGWVIDLAHEQLGAIDLDPASNAYAQRHVRAERWYSLDKGEDGLILPWEGRVWLNPPYSRGLIAPFCARAVEQVDQGHVSAALVLVNTSSSAAWWQQIAAASRWMLFFSRRIRFEHEQTERVGGSPRYDNTLFALGSVRPGAFREHGLIASAGGW